MGSANTLASRGMGAIMSLSYIISGLDSDRSGGIAEMSELVVGMAKSNEKCQGVSDVVASSIRRFEAISDGL